MLSGSSRRLRLLRLTTYGKVFESFNAPRIIFRQNCWRKSSTTWYPPARGALFFDFPKSVRAGDRQSTAHRDWAECVLSIPLDKRKVTEVYLDRLKTILTRSSPHSISVRLYQKGHAATAASSTLVDAIIHSARRWRSLDLDLSRFELSQLEDLPPGTFETLETLSFHDLTQQTQAVTVFQSSPRLRHLTLRPLYESASYFPLFLMPWSQLTLLNVSDSSLGGCRMMLMQCSNLQSAVLQTSHEWDFPVHTAASSVVPLPFLKTLTVTFSGRPADTIGGVEAFFIPLALPSLTKLDLTFDMDAYEDWPTEVFTDFQRRSPNIEEINLLYCTITSQGFIAMLRHASALTTLCVHNSWNCIDGDFFEALRYDRVGPAPLAPKLQDIDFWCVGDFEEHLFEEAIRSRWWKDDALLSNASESPPSVVRLKTVSVGRDDSGSQNVSDELKVLVDEGLELYFS
ncbi:hypothetical protein DFH07DRAFT_1034979 [Mycena maculata]|uniref:F-box domain-containing protein n=1 Tax=Mycena maculata TaxID=230809 RepID=A0AAD7IVH1_9AGAR|nr:hypothetical protein DFH07DRAFT_1034979 [Mycena maculata]